MQRARFDALGAPVAQASEMAFGRREFGGAQRGFFGYQLSRNFDIAGHEDAESQLEVVEDFLMEGLQFCRTFLRENDLALDLLCREFHQILIDDIPDMLQVRNCKEIKV